MGCCSCFFSFVFFQSWSLLSGFWFCWFSCFCLLWCWFSLYCCIVVYLHILLASCASLSAGGLVLVLVLPPLLLPCPLSCLLISVSGYVSFLIIVVLILLLCVCACAMFGLIAMSWVASLLGPQRAGQNLYVVHLELRGSQLFFPAVYLGRQLVVT